YTHVHGHSVQALSRRWCSARSLEKTIADRTGDHFTESHEFQPDPHLTEKVVPSRTVTDNLPTRGRVLPVRCTFDGATRLGLWVSRGSIQPAGRPRVQGGQAETSPRGAGRSSDRRDP